jgi:hypothetical protein
MYMIINLGSCLELVMRFAKKRKRGAMTGVKWGPFDWWGCSSTKLKRDPLAQQEGLSKFPHDVFHR